jgi:hypothetical protein
LFGALNADVFFEISSSATCSHPIALRFARKSVAGNAPRLILFATGASVSSSGEFSARNPARPRETEARRCRTQFANMAAYGHLWRLSRFLFAIYVSLASQIELWKASLVIYPGGILLATLFDFVFLRETLGWIEIVGLILGYASMLFFLHSSS